MVSLVILFRILAFCFGTISIVMLIGMISLTLKSKEPDIAVIFMLTFMATFSCIMSYLYLNKNFIDLVMS